MQEQGCETPGPAAEAARRALSAPLARLDASSGRAVVALALLRERVRALSEELGAASSRCAELEREIARLSSDNRLLLEGFVSLLRSIERAGVPINDRIEAAVLASGIASRLGVKVNLMPSAIEPFLCPAMEPRPA